MGPVVLVGWNNFTPLKDGEWKFSSPYSYIFFHPFLDIVGPLLFGGVAQPYTWRFPHLDDAHVIIVMGRYSLVPLDRKEMALVSLQRMPEEKRQKALPAVKQGILKRRGPVALFV